MHADQCLTSTAVQSRAISRGHLLVDRVAYQCMGELVTSGNFCVGLDYAGLYGGLETGQHLLHIFVGSGSDLPSHELAPVHRGDTEQIVTSSRKSNQTSPNSLAHARRHFSLNEGNSRYYSFIDNNVD